MRTMCSRSISSRRSGVGRVEAAKRFLDLQRGPRRQNERTLDHVLELPHVAGPAVVHQRVHHALGHRVDSAAEGRSFRPRKIPQ
jgi:hypothetical protein